MSDPVYDQYRSPLEMGCPTPIIGSRTWYALTGGATDLEDRCPWDDCIFPDCRPGMGCPVSRAFRAIISILKWRSLGHGNEPSPDCITNSMVTESQGVTSECS